MCFNRTNNTRGFPPIIFHNTYGHAGFREDPCSALPASVRFQKNMCGLQSEANLAIQKDALSKDTGDRAFVLQSTIDVWLTRFDKLETDCPSATGEITLPSSSDLPLTAPDRFYSMNSRLSISACNLLVPSRFIAPGILTAMYDLACNIIEAAMELDEEEGFADYGPIFNHTDTLLAAFVILRIGKSHLRDNVNQQRGKRCYFATIAMSKRHSVRSDDVAARASIILPQLFTSKSVIRGPEGSPDSLWLRCRNRLGFSVLFDCLWLWRQEFGGQPNSYDKIPDESTGSNDPPAMNHDPGPLPENPLNLMGLDWSPETLLQDFQWPQIDDAFNNEWQSMINTSNQI